MKEEEGRGRRKEEGGRRSEEGGGRSEKEGGKTFVNLLFFLVVLISTLGAALFVKNMSDVLILMGATINPLVK